MPAQEKSFWAEMRPTVKAYARLLISLWLSVLVMGCEYWAFKGFAYVFGDSETVIRVFSHGYVPEIITVIAILFALASGWWVHKLLGRFSVFQDTD